MYTNVNKTCVLETSRHFAKKKSLSIGFASLQTRMTCIATLFQLARETRRGSVENNVDSLVEIVNVEGYFQNKMSWPWIDPLQGQKD